LLFFSTKYPSSPPSHITNDHRLKNSRKSCPEWTLIKEFDNGASFEEHLNKLDIPWAKRKSHHTNEGMKSCFRCSFKGCTYECRAFYTAHNCKVVLEETPGTRHTHITQGNNASKLLPEFKENDTQSSWSSTKENFARTWPLLHDKPVPSYFRSRLSQWQQSNDLK
jgi:hypothetical protein